MRTDIRVLGPVELRRGDRRVDLGPPKQSGVFAILAAEVGRTLSADRLEYRLWADHPPRHARRTLHSYLTRLRGVLADLDGLVLERRSSGYVLDVDAECVDLYRFRRLCGEARSAATVSEASRLWHEALAVWNGDAFADLDIPGLNKLRSELHGARDIAELERNDAFIHTGRSAQLLPHIRTRVAQRPLDERLSGQLMEVLYRLGRVSEALEHYRTLHDRMSGELGHEPGADLRRLHRRILTGEPAEGADPPAAAVPVVVPRQLPGSPARFTGRDDELRRLGAVPEPGDASPVRVVCGPGGVGKTWLTIRWAHDSLDRFGDGQLYADLRGFDPVAEPVSPETVLAEFLAALGVANPAIPKTLAARSALFRSLVSAKRLLVILDNARDAEQVVPLLPGTDTCATVVTSRRDLTALTAAHGARRLVLGRLSRDDAHQILRTHLDPARLDAEPEAVERIIHHCAGLPLALGIVAARALSYPDFPLSALAAELADETGRLDLLDTGELATGVRAVLNGSYRALTKEAAGVFDLCGLTPGTGWNRYALASLTGLPLRELRPILSELEQARLLEQFEPGRYRMHDLTGLYAAERAERDVGEPRRTAALRRWVDHQLHAANANCLVVEPLRRPWDVGEPVPGCVWSVETEPARAQAWLAKEEANLLYAQRIAARNGWSPAGRLGILLSGYWQRRGRYEPAAAVAAVAIDSGVPADSPVERARLHAGLANALGFLGDLEQAAAAATAARALIDGADGGAAAGYVYSASAFIASRQGRFRQAIEFDLRVLDVDRAAGWPHHEGNTLNGLGWSHAMSGDLGAAERYCREALEHFRRHPNPHLEAGVFDTLGFIALGRAQPGRALDHYRRALNQMLIERRNNAGRALPHESDVVEHIGDAYRDLGDLAHARRYWRRAVDGYRSHHQDDDADRVRDKLNKATGPVPT